MLVLLVVLAGAAQAAPVEYYASKYDHIDVEAILNNRRMVNYYAACLLSEGPCPPEGLEFKRILPEALRTKCERCTEKQKAVTLRTFRRLRKEYPKVWARLQVQWDPDDVFVRKFEETFDKKGSESVVVPLTNRFALEEPIEPSRVNSVEIKRPNVIVATTIKVSPSTSAPSTTTTSSPSTKRSPSTTTTPSPPSTKPPSRSSPSPSSINRPFTGIRLPLPDIGANIGATVSFGTDLVGEIVKGIGEFGTKALETGVVIADAVFKNFSLQKTAEIRF